MFQTTKFESGLLGYDRIGPTSCTAGSISRPSDTLGPSPSVVSTARDPPGAHMYQACGKPHPKNMVRPQLAIQRSDVVKRRCMICTWLSKKLPMDLKKWSVLGDWIIFNHHIASYFAGNSFSAQLNIA